MADAPTDAGAWECEVDLAALQAPAGSLKLDFDVEAQAGTVDESPDGKRTVEYRPPKPTWRSARQVLPKGCYGPALTVDAVERLSRRRDMRRSDRLRGGRGDRRLAQDCFKSPARPHRRRSAARGRRRHAVPRLHAVRPADRRRHVRGTGIPSTRTSGSTAASARCPTARGRRHAARPRGRRAVRLPRRRRDDPRDGPATGAVASRYETDRRRLDRGPRAAEARVDGTSLRVGDDGKATDRVRRLADGAIKARDRRRVGRHLDRRGRRGHSARTRSSCSGRATSRTSSGLDTRARTVGCGGSDGLDAQGTYYATLRGRDVDVGADHQGDGTDVIRRSTRRRARSRARERQFQSGEPGPSHALRTGAGRRMDGDAASDPGRAAASSSGATRRTGRWWSPTRTATASA